MDADPSLSPARVVTSPLRRALDTARAIRSPTPPRGDPRLMEIGQGDWEGRTHRELEVEDAVRYAAWRSTADALPPGGETREDARARAVDALTEALATDGWPLCVVTHGGIMRLLAQHLLRIEREVAWRLDVDNVSLSVLEPVAEGGWQIDRWNDVRHVLDRGAVHVAEQEGSPTSL